MENASQFGTNITPESVQQLQNAQQILLQNVVGTPPHQPTVAANMNNTSAFTATQHQTTPNQQQNVSTNDATKVSTPGGADANAAMSSMV